MRVYRNSLYYLCNSSVNVKIFQNTKFKKRFLLAYIIVVRAHEHRKIKACGQFVKFNQKFPLIFKNFCMLFLSVCVS